MQKNIVYIGAVLAIVSLVVATYGFVAFQGQISGLDNSNRTLETSVNDLKSTVTTLEGQVTDYQAAIADYQATITEYQETIAEQQETIKEYQQVTLVDSMGNVVVLTSPPERVVSLAPSNTEILFAIGAGDTVVGVTDFCDYPYNFTAWIEAGNMTSIGSYYGPSVEPIVALEPDLVLASSGSLDAAANLQSLGYNVLVVEAKTIDGVLQDILMVGRATGHEIDAGTLVGSMRAAINAVADETANVETIPKVYHEVWNEPLMSAGPGTFIDELITLAGGENIFNDATTSWPTVSSEAIIQKNPDVMIYPDMYMGVQNFYETIEVVKTRSGWDVINAVQNDALYEIDADIISRSGPRLVDALETLAQLIHPEIFG
ncbi:MAG: helical backbone metal receptor [Candidatus Bathyarchaeota archaeon]|nr:helical backbone metal receptor [Candidatus Bathyarchaeota archaeon]